MPVRGGLLARVQKGILSEVFSNLSRVVIQVSSVPLFLGFWGTTRYGEWLLLTAILGYLRLSNVGFTQATRNKMSMAVSAGERTAALRYFQSTSWLFLAIGLLLVLLMGAVALDPVPIARALNFDKVDTGSVGVILLLMAGIIAVNFQAELLEAGFRCEGHYGLGTFLYTLGELLIFVLIVIAVVAGAGPVGAACSFFLGTVVRFCFLRARLRKIAPWVVFGRSHVSFATLKAFIQPSLAFMAFPAGQAMILQGVLIVIGNMLGPAAVVTFNTLRMLSRYAVYLTIMCVRVSGPELAFAYSRGQQALVRRVHWQVCQVGFWLVAGACAALGIGAPWIFWIWTGGEIEVIWSVYLPLLASVLIWNAHTLAGSVLQETNNHRDYAKVYVVVTSVCMLASYGMISLFGLQGAALASLACEIALLAYVLPRAIGFTGGTIAAFLRQLATPPSLVLIKALRTRSAT